MKVVITRPEPSASEWERQLKLAQVEVLKLPLIDIKEIARDSFSLAYQAILLQKYDAWMFVSPNAVHHFFNHFPTHDYVKQFSTIRFWANGLGTIQALRDRGIAIERIDGPASNTHQFDSESLWNTLKEQLKNIHHVLILRGQSEFFSEDFGKGNGRNWLADQLMSVGIDVNFLAVYRRTLPVWTSEQKARAFSAFENQSIWLLTSSEGVNNLKKLGPSLPLKNAIGIATHPRISFAANNIGFGSVYVVSPLLSKVVQCIREIKKSEYPRG